MFCFVCLIDCGFSDFVCLFSVWLLVGFAVVLVYVCCIGLLAVYLLFCLGWDCLICSLRVCLYSFDVCFDCVCFTFYGYYVVLVWMLCLSVCVICVCLGLMLCCIIFLRLFIFVIMVLL